MWEMSVYACDNVTAWQCDNVTVWKCNSVTLWQSNCSTVWPLHSPPYYNADWGPAEERRTPVQCTTHWESSRSPCTQGKQWGGWTSPPPPSTQRAETRHLNISIIPHPTTRQEQETECNMETSASGQLSQMAKSPSKVVSFTMEGGVRQ